MTAFFRSHELPGCSGFSKKIKWGVNFFRADDQGACKRPTSKIEAMVTPIKATPAAESARAAAAKRSGEPVKPRAKHVYPCQS